MGGLLHGAEVGDELGASCFMLGWVFLMVNRAEFMRYSMTDYYGN